MSDRIWVQSKYPQCYAILQSEVLNRLRDWNKVGAKESITTSVKTVKNSNTVVTLKQLKFPTVLTQESCTRFGEELRMHHLSGGTSWHRAMLGGLDNAVLRRIYLGQQEKQNYPFLKDW